MAIFRARPLRAHTQWRRSWPARSTTPLGIGLAQGSRGGSRRDRAPCDRHRAGQLPGCRACATPSAPHAILKPVGRSAVGARSPAGCVACCARRLAARGGRGAARRGWASSASRGPSPTPRPSPTPCSCRATCAAAASLPLPFFLTTRARGAPGELDASARSSDARSRLPLACSRASRAIACARGPWRCAAAAL